MLKLIDGVLVDVPDYTQEVYTISLEDVTKRLKQLGYVPCEADEDQMTFELNKIVNYVLNYCNIKTIPAILNPRIIDRVCAEFLYYKKNCGALDMFDFDYAIKSIKEGDTQIQYAVGDSGDTPESRFDAFLNKLERGFDKWITPHRAIRW